MVLKKKEIGKELVRTKGKFVLEDIHPGPLTKIRPKQTKIVKSKKGRHGGSHLSWS